MDPIFIMLAGVIVGAVITFSIMKIMTPKIVDLSEDLKSAQGLAALNSDNLNLLRGRHEVVEQDRDGLETKLSDAEAEITRLNRDNSSLTERLSSEKLLVAQSAQIREKFIEEFKNAANEIVVNNTSRFNESSSAKLSEVLKPFNEKMSEFEKSIKTIRDEEIRDTTELKTEIKSIRDLNTALTNEARRLTDALRGDNKIQGNWGELVLENILNASGLKKDHDYITQARGLDLKDFEDTTQRPDFLIRLPDEKYFILDSKVSLKSYERYYSAENETERAAALKEFHVSVKTHIKGLGKKGYHANEKLNTPEFVLLFIPIEGAFTLYLETCENAYDYAQDRNVHIVSPTTVMPALKTAALIWKQQKQARNVAEIIHKAGEIYDKFAIMSEHLVKIGTTLDRSKEAYLEYRDRLSTGKNPILELFENLKDLGARTNKEILIKHKSYLEPILVESNLEEVLKSQTELESESDQ